MDEPFGALDPLPGGACRTSSASCKRRLRKTRGARDPRRARGAAAGRRGGGDGRAAASLQSGHAARDARVAPGRLRARLPGGRAAVSRPCSRSWRSGARELLALTGQHLVLVLVSTAVAVAIGLPLGIAMTRRPRLARRAARGWPASPRPIPSLALFGFLIPLPFIGGIGARTAIVALVLYALLPILRNTYTGILQVDAAVLEAATGMGMTRRPAPAPGRAAAGPARDPGRRAHRGRGRRSGRPPSPPPSGPAGWAPTSSAASPPSTPA